MEGQVESCANHVFHTEKSYHTYQLYHAYGSVYYSVAIKHAKQNVVNVLHSNKARPKLRFI